MVTYFKYSFIVVLFTGSLTAMDAQKAAIKVLLGTVTNNSNKKLRILKCDNLFGFQAKNFDEIDALDTKTFKKEFFVDCLGVTLRFLKHSGDNSKMPDIFISVSRDCNNELEKLVATNHDGIQREKQLINLKAISIDIILEGQEPKLNDVVLNGHN